MTTEQKRKIEKIESILGDNNLYSKFMESATENFIAQYTNHEGEVVLKKALLHPSDLDRKIAENSGTEVDQPKECYIIDDRLSVFGKPYVSVLQDGEFITTPKKWVEEL